MLTREFLVKKKCLLIASWTVKIAPVLESSFSGFLQDLIRLKKIDDICGCKLLNGQTGKMLRSKRLVFVALTSYQVTLKSSFIIPFCLLKLEGLDCMNSFFCSMTQVHDIYKTINLHSLTYRKLFIQSRLSSLSKQKGMIKDDFNVT